MPNMDSERRSESKNGSRSAPPLRVLKSWAEKPPTNIVTVYTLATIAFLTGLRWRKNKYRPDLECSTAFSINSTTVGLLNRVKLPKLKFPAKTIMRLNDLVTVSGEVSP